MPPDHLSEVWENRPMSAVYLLPIADSEALACIVRDRWTAFGEHRPRGRD
jgi:hypothetical protein